ncbi:protein DpdF [Lentzea sp. NPDC055074]
MADTMIFPGLPDEEETLRRLLADPKSATWPPFSDDLHARVAHLALSSEGSQLDFAVLVRQLIRRWSLRDERGSRLAMGPLLSARLRTAADSVGLWEIRSDVWAATPWQPDWLEQGVPDAAAVAGTSRGKRFHSGELPADPFFEEYTGHQRYRTPGQRAACRAVVSMPSGSTIIAMLPTGSGKTEVALCLAERFQHAVTLIVVPTVALAYDFERRFRDHYAKRNPAVDKTALHFAWTADTSPELRTVMKSRVQEGRQRLLVTSPESMTRALREVLLEAAGIGRLGALVIDEAHLVAQWGRDFRPEFRTLAALRTELVDSAFRHGLQVPMTLLLSATLGSFELEDLNFLFGKPGPCTLIAANAFRAEPELWIHADSDAETRQSHVLDALAHLSRPAVLYVTSPHNAITWVDRLRARGYRRLAAVTGETTTEDRIRVLEGLRSSPESPSAIDLVVATSAFGLGIDYPHIRSVVHACLPETVDRWYQEVGRGGRDGDASIGLLVTEPRDQAEARRLTTTVLGPEKAMKRWIDIWHHRQELDGDYVIDLEGSSGDVAEGSYNRRWNAQLVQGLVELDVCSRLQIDYEDRTRLRTHDHRPSDWVGLKLRRGDLDDEAFWQKRWGPWQAAEIARSQQSLSSIVSLAQRGGRACESIAHYYRPTDRTYELFGRAAELAAPSPPCGRCPGCRRDGVSPPELPLPSPPEAWPLSSDAVPELDLLAAAAGAQNGLILLTTDDHDHVSLPLAKSLVRRGVRHLAGDMPGTMPSDAWFFYEARPINPTELTPCSSLVIYPAGCHIPGTWLLPSVRAAHRQFVDRAFDVLLVERDAQINGRHVGRDLAALDAGTALEILGSRS